MDKSNDKLTQIENLPLSERVLALLRDAILSGKYPPGRVLVENELSSQLKVSRAPIREALQILHTEGLVTIIPYHKTIVRQISLKDVQELYDLRNLLETFAIQQILFHYDGDKVLQLKQVYGDMLTSAESGDLTSVSELDRSFHDLLINLSGHDTLSRTWKVISFRVRQVMALRHLHRKMDKQEVVKIAVSHLPIIEAIAEQNEHEAVRLIQEHIATSGDLLAAEWMQEEDGT